MVPPTASPSSDTQAAPEDHGRTISLLRPVDFVHQLLLQLKQWFREQGLYFLASTTVHCLLLILLALFSLWAPIAWTRSQKPVGFDAADAKAPEPPLERFEVGNSPLDPSVLTTETLTETRPPAQTAQYNDDSAVFQEAGGGMKLDKQGPLLGGLGGLSADFGPGPAGKGGVGVGVGEGDSPGTGGAGVGFGSRGTGHRDALLGAFGGTKASERAVAAALNWLARHQFEHGNWSLEYGRRCSGGTCSGEGWVKSDVAATGLALLPFLGAGQTHKSKGPYQKTINKGLSWLMGHQRPDGNLAGSSDQMMYSHGIATIAICEAYGLTKDPYVGSAASKAIHFIEKAQNLNTGGWRYQPGEDGDTSVTGWQVMALKSAHLAGMGVDSVVWQKVNTWLKSTRKGQYGGLYAYQPFREATPVMTAVGMLCDQYQGTRPENPRMREGRDYLMANLPDPNADRNFYYWYYATMTMHNLLGPEWDTWNRRMRRVLIESQDKEGCAAGSWDPEKPSLDAWGGQGGRLMMTSFAALTLEIYYRYLPLYQVDAPNVPGGQPSQPARPAAPPAGKEGRKPTPASERSPAPQSPPMPRGGDK